MRKAIFIPLMLLSALPAFADHNSNFGDNTGRTVDGVHDNRIDSNQKGSANSTAMGQGTFSVQAQGSLGGYQQGGHPATVTPGTGGKSGGGR